MSLLIATPLTLIFNELLVGNTIWRTTHGDVHTFRVEAIPRVLFVPLDIFGPTGFSRMFYWTPEMWAGNFFIVWWFTFLSMTYIRRS